MDLIFILSLALVIDMLLGDPPTTFHPVGWMGKLIAILERFSPQNGAIAQFLYGIAMVLIGVAVFTVPVVFLLIYLDDTSEIATIIVGALLLKSTFSITGLRRSANRVRERLQSNDLSGARRETGALVSRETGALSEPLIVAATVESVSENSSDGIIAPLFWFLLLSVPGAVGYRMVNTFDSMIGYRGEYEHLGKFAARLDDVLNFVPARLTALLLVIAAFISRNNGSGAFRIMMSDHGKTSSPNAGWPMGAAAGALGVELEKVGHYKLGSSQSIPTPQKITDVICLMYLTAFLWVAICFGILGVRDAVAS